MQSRFLKTPVVAYLSTMTGQQQQTHSSSMTTVSTTLAASASSTTTTTSHVNETSDGGALQYVRTKLVLPTYQETLRRDTKAYYEFWNTNDKVLQQAWKEWDETDPIAVSLPTLDDSIIHPKLRSAVNIAWKVIGRTNKKEKVDDNDTTNNNSNNDEKDMIHEIETSMKELWEEVAPNVYGIQFFDLQRLHKLQEWFVAIQNSGIPTRPPYGIVLNRKGCMIDSRSVGYVASPKFQSFYMDILVNSYIRPLSRLLYPRDISSQDDDSESFAFTIQYQAGGDESIRPHTDSSTITFNINLDTTQTWTGSSLYFWNTTTKTKTRERFTVNWKPGYAIMHLGTTLHAATPIESGTRSNFVIWTFGTNKKNMAYGVGSTSSPLTLDDDDTPEEYKTMMMTPKQRWTKPTTTSVAATSWDRWSPF